MQRPSLLTRRLRTAALAALLALSGLTAPGCGGGEVSAVDDAPPRVYTTFYPTTWLVERIAGDAVEVVCPLPEGEDPIFWQPPREALAEYQAADLIVVNGAEFEKWIASASLPESRIVDTTRNLAGTFLRYETTTHSHGPGGEHTHQGIDGHTWVDPQNAKLQARAIWSALSDLLPAEAAHFEAGRRALDQDLDALHEAVRALVPRLKAVRLLASHPAYDYLARRHGLELVSFDLDPEATPTEEQVQALAAALDGGQGPALLLWESEPRPEAVELLRGRLGLESVLFSPCEGPPAEGDYLDAMRANLARLEAALGGS